MSVQKVDQAGQRSLIDLGGGIKLRGQARRKGRRGLRIATVEASEVAKAEGAVTCCSLILGLKSLEPEPKVPFYG